MFQVINCPNCRRKIKAILKSNRWVKWIEIYCDSCDYRKNIHDTELDYIQPSSPFFKAIYGHDPIELARRERREEERKENNLKDERDINLKLKLEPWDRDYIKKYARERGLD